MPGKKVTKDCTARATPGTHVACTDNGWSNREVFEDFMKNHFAQNVPGFGKEWVLVLYDGHKTHSGLNLMK